MSSAPRTLPESERKERAEKLGGEIRLLASYLHATLAEMAAKLAAFDDLTGWEGFRSCADWLGLNAAMSSSRAGQLVRVGHALEELPQVRDAVRSGALSFDGAAELTRVATPEDQTMWLQVAASATGPQLARICRATSHVFDLESREHADDQLRRRGVWTSYGEDGMCTLRAVLPPEDMAVVTSALERTMRRLDAVDDSTPSPSDDEAVAQHAVSDPALEPLSARWADALVAICKDMRVRDASELDADPSTMPMVVHVDVEALVGHVTPDATSQVRRHVDAAPLSHAVLRRLACDTSVVTIIERDGSPLDVGRRHRIVPPKLRLVVQTRDITCRFPGCKVSARRCDMDHIVDWIDGGETTRSNIAALCTFHHGRKHQGVFRYFGDPDGELTFEFANGKRVKQRLPDVDRQTPITDSMSTVLPVEVVTTGGAPPHASGRMNLPYVVGVLAEAAIAMRPRPPSPAD